MKKIILIVFLGLSSLYARDFMVKIEPYQKHEIKSQSQGIIEYVSKDLESKYINTKQLLMKIDSKDEQIQLEKQKKSLKIQEKIVELKKRNYIAKKKIKLISRYEKDQAHLNYLEPKKELVSIQEDIKNLENEISKKRFDVNNVYVNKIYVAKSEYVNISDRLYDVYDISKEKIKLYLSRDEIKSLDKKKVYIDGKESDFKVYKIYKIKDDTRISRYKVEFIKDNKNLQNHFFENIVKVSLK